MREPKKLTVQQFKREDADLLIDTNGIDPSVKQLMESWKEAYATLGPGFSVFDGEKLLWCIGAVQYWPGTAEGWMLVPADMRAYAREIYYYSKILLDEAMKSWNFKRIQARVKADFTVGQRFLERLGFEREGLLRKMGPNYEDYYMYARVE
jgi:hypothetical protein